MADEKGLKDEVKDVLVVAGYSLALVGLFWGAYHLLKFLFAA